MLLSHLRMPPPPPNAAALLLLQPKLETLETSSSETLTLSHPPPIHSPPHFPLLPNLPNEHHRLSHLLHSPNTNPNPNPNPKRKKRPRSSDLQRVSSLSPSQELDARSTLRRARILYESIRVHLASASPAGSRRSPSRSDLGAGTLMNEADLWLNRDRRIVGLVPGLRVGDLFFYRLELCVLGVHGQSQGGIDFVPARRSPDGEPVATSIVFSGGYEDDEDRGDVILYTGHGGREGRRRSNGARQGVDQKLDGGNLAMERSCHYGIEVRVFRGLDCRRSPTGRAYVYDGLYRVARCWNEKGKSGFAVCKFELARLQGQEEMGSVAMKFAEDLRKDPMGVRPDGYLSLDISKGEEKEPIAAFNDVDCDRAPLSCDYLVCPEFSSLVKQPGGRGCQCDSDCSVVGCACAGRNGGAFAYDCDGRLLRGRPWVYECGRCCGCPPSCGNRVSQRGLRHRLEVFRSREGRWAVRSLDVVQAGEFVCEYSGIPLTMQQAELAAANGALMVDPNRLPRRWEEWGDLSMVVSGYEKPELASLPEVGYLMDVSRERNVACYIGHSCNPNVFVQFVLADHYNVSYPRLMIFAMEHIPPMRELSLDYGVGAV